MGEGDISDVTRKLRAEGLSHKEIGERFKRAEAKAKADPGGKNGHDPDDPLGSDSGPFADFQQSAQSPPDKPTWEQDLAASECTSLQLSTLPIPAREPVMGDWCYVADLGFIYAIRGVGKTWWAMDLAHNIAEPRKMGPWEAPKQRSVLYLDGEMPPSDIKYRDGVLGLPIQNLAYVNHEILFQRTGRIMNLADVSFQNGVIGRCQAEHREVLFLDNLSTLTSGVNENDGIDWELIQPWLLQLRRLHITVIFIHHAGRNNEMRGHSKREDPASWIIRLDLPNDAEEKDGARFISRFTKWRNAITKPVALEWHYKPINETDVCVEFKEASPLTIFRHLVESGLTTCSDLAKEMEVTPGYISQLATKAEKHGWLKIQGRKYTMKAQQEG